MQLFREKVDQRGNNSRRNNFKNISNYYSRKHLKSHLAGTFLGKSLTKCTFFVFITNPRWPPQQGIF